MEHYKNHHRYLFKHLVTEDVIIVTMIIITTYMWQSFARPFSITSTTQRK